MTTSPRDTAGRLGPKWAYVRPSEPVRLVALRDLLWRAAGEPDGWKRSWPHVTLHHHFSASPAAAREAQEALSSFRGRSLVLGEPYAYPSRERPRVVCCPVEPDMSEEREALRGAVDGEFHDEFRPAHVTLFRRSGRDHDAPDIDAALRFAQGPFPTEVSAAALVVARPF